MDTSDFKFIFLGQSVLKYQVPLDIFMTINHIYDVNKDRLDKANQQLVGKIEDEHSLFYDGVDQTKMKNHNRLPITVTHYFIEMFKHYLNFLNSSNGNKLRLFFFKFSLTL